MDEITRFQTENHVIKGNINIIFDITVTMDFKKKKISLVVNPTDPIFQRFYIRNML